MLRANHQTNRPEFQLNLDLSSILDDFDDQEKRDLEAAQVSFCQQYCFRVLSFLYGSRIEVFSTEI